MFRQKTDFGAGLFVRLSCFFSMWLGEGEREGRQ